jgi:hypothetical protein
MKPRSDPPFERLVRYRTDTGFVERRWLKDEIESALDAEPCRIVLVTGEPGAGKTSMLSGLARDNPEWLRYFVAQRDGGVHAAGDVTSFLLSIGNQFARQWPEAFDVKRLEVVVQQQIDNIEAGGSAVGIKISDLTVSPFHRTATLEIEQRAGRVAGSLAGVEIGTAHLEPRLLAPANLAHLALVAPAEVLFAKDPSARIVILLDAFDDAARSGVGDGLLDWLSAGGVLPPNVRLVVSSRPTSALGRLRTGRAGHLTEIGIDPADRRVSADLATYAGSVLGVPDVDEAVRARGLLPDQFHRRVTEHASGNFQYLASYARALADAIAEGAEEPTSRLLRLDSFPSDLAGMYAFFAETARQDIERLGMLDVMEPRGDQDTVTPAWEGVGQPLLGVLTVARESLSIEQLTQLTGVRVWPRAVRNVLSRLRWLLDVRGDQVAFFHQSIGDFLLGDQAAAECPECHVDEAEWHERIVRHYRGSAGSWEEVDWAGVDRYGLAHLAAHLEHVAPRDLVRLVNPGLLQAVRRTFRTDQRFTDLVDRSAALVTRTGDVAGALSDVMFLGVVRHQIATVSQSLPPAALGLLARRGRLEEALERVSAMPASTRQFAGMLEIVRHARPGAGDPSHEDLIESLVETAAAFGGGYTEGGSHDRADGSWAAIKVAAQVLAPRDLDRALRLWDHGKRTVAGQRTPEEYPDALYLAAAQKESDARRACELIAHMRANHTSAYLDLADRAGPGTIADVLRHAESHLGDLKPAPRLSALGRLAAAWAPLEPAKSAALLAEARAVVFAAVTDSEFGKNVAAAAEAVHDADPGTARMLLASLDATVVNGHSFGGCLRAVELWTEWGAPERARALARRMHAWNRERDEWSHLRMMSVLNNMGRAERIRGIERIHAAIPDAHEVHGYMESGDRDRSLASVAREFAQYDPARAAEIAEGISRTAWPVSLGVRDASDANGIPLLDTYVNVDRYSVLADVAHRCLDLDDEPAADRLLDAILRDTEVSAPLGSGTENHPAYMRASVPDPRLNEGKAGRYRQVPVHPIGEPKSIRQFEMEGIMVVFNISHEWSARAKRYFYRDPADLVRAVSLGPYTLARTARVIAERRAGRDPARSATVVRTIEDPGERAIGLAALHLAAHTPDHGPDAEALSQELDRTLLDLEEYRWTMERGDLESRAWAYIRPDLRVRFEVAVRALGCRGQDYEALRHLTFLGQAMGKALYLWISRRYASELAAGKRPDPIYKEAHEALLAGRDGDPLFDIAQAQAACEELRIRTVLPHRRSATPWGQISNPVYGAVLALANPEPGSPLNPAFAAAVRDLTEQGRLPAAAELTTFASQTRPECAADLRDLAEEIILAVADSTPAVRVETLSRLTGADALTGLVDLEKVFSEAERCSPEGGAFWVAEDAQAQVFPVMLSEAPAAALHKLYEAAATRWGTAMRLLESAADPLAAAFDGDPTGALAAGIRRGLACTARDGRLPETVDGVRIEELARLDRIGGGW